MGYQLSNPFVIDRPLSPDNDRISLVVPNSRIVIERLVQGSCCILVGPPGAGTTSWSRQIAKAFCDRYPNAIWVWVDAGSDPEISPIGIASAIGRQVLGDDSVQFHTRSADPVVEAYTALMSIMSRIERAVIVSVDHLELAPDNVIIDVMRLIRLIQGRSIATVRIERSVTFVISGTLELLDSAMRHGSPLSFAERFWLTDASVDELDDFLRNAEEVSDIKFDDDARMRLYAVSGGDRYLIQRFGYVLAKRSMAKQGEVIRRAMVDSLVDKFVESEYRMVGHLARVLEVAVENAILNSVLCQLLADPDVQIDECILGMSGARGVAFSVLRAERHMLGFRGEVHRRVIELHESILGAGRRVHMALEPAVDLGYHVGRVLVHELKRWSGNARAEVEILNMYADLTNTVIAESIGRISAATVQHERVVSRLGMAYVPDRLWRPELRKEELSDFVGDAVDGLAGRLAMARRSVSRNFATGAVDVLIDRDLMLIVVENLVDNALQYSADGEIGVETGSDGDSAWFAVWDEGPGIAEAYRESVFRLFNRGPLQESDRSVPGNMGVGLYLVAQIVSVHGGRVVYDASGGGARFIVTLDCV